MGSIRLQPRAWLGYPGTPDCTGTFCIAALAFLCLVPPVLLHPGLETMWEVWPAGSQQLHLLPNTQLEVGGKTTRGCISVVGNSSSAPPSKERNHCTDVIQQTASESLLCCAETEQTSCILRQKLHWPRVIGPQRKGSAVGKPIGSRARLGCQETL